MIDEALPRHVYFFFSRANALLFLG